MPTEKERINYLLNVYFGDYANHEILSAVERAYLDLARTQHGFAKIKEKQQIQEQRKSFLISAIEHIRDSQFTEQNEFDEYHRKVMMELKHLSRNNFSIGQAQKWVNMSIKYCLIIAPSRYEKNILFFHVPIDNIVLSELSDYQFSCRWSRLDDYDEYLRFQNWFRGKFPDKAPILTELTLWYRK